MSNYFGLKLRTGKTVFCEIVTLDDKNHMYVIKDALAFDERQSKSGDLSVSFMPFAVYAKSRVHQIQGDEIFMADPLSDKFVRMYGEALMSFDISQIKMSVYERLTGNINDDYVHLLKMIDDCKKVAETYSEKFNGIDIPDFSEMEQKIMENRPSIN
jgi:hypothetical protein